MLRDLQTSSFYLNVKNIIGPKTDKKIVAFAVDDYGNVRLASKKARENMDKAGMKILTRFDSFDTLETEDDLNNLYETLSSVKDRNGNNAVFTAFALSANINFEKVKENGYTSFHYESLPETLAKLKGYEKVYDLWKEGIDKKILMPEFHGREHLNIKMFEEALAKKDKEVLLCLENRSYTSISTIYYPTINYTFAFDFYEMKENEKFSSIIETGVELFEKVYGIKAELFSPPGSSYSSSLNKTLRANGIKYLDLNMIRSEHLGLGKYKKTFNYLGQKKTNDQTAIVRNCVFEPTSDRNVDWVSFCIKQIKAAFNLKKPAIISSHRVNFCGHINEKNREIGLGDLKKLLKEITAIWPDVEFMSLKELSKMISNKNKN